MKTQVQPTLGDLVKFVLENRKNRAYQNYPERMLVQELVSDMEHDCLRYAINKDTGNIVGIITYALFFDCKMLYVNQLIAIEPWVLKSFIVLFVQTLPGWRVESTDSRGNHLTYNTDKLVRRILKHG